MDTMENWDINAASHGDDCVCRVCQERTLAGFMWRLVPRQLALLLEANGYHIHTDGKSYEVYASRDQIQECI